MLLLLAGAAEAGPRGRRDVEVPPDPAAAPLAPPSVALFDAPLPLDPGPVPAGLASMSAQACNACHYAAHDGWVRSPHATGWRAADWVAAVRDVGTPACASCHLPLRDQHGERWGFDDDRVDHPIRSPNPTWDATLAIEGVTCAACHVRDGVVLSSHPPNLDQTAPHPLAWAPDLTRSEGCAACHQLTWPGADVPFYDTFGEWQRSPHAVAGITCQDCHLSPGAAERSLGPDHGMQAAAGRAVSVLVDLPAATLTRGGAVMEVTVRLQNTGAGHAWPTGSPFSGARLSVALVGPDGTQVPVGDAPLARQIDTIPPYSTLRDTRLAPGEERTVAFPLSLGQDKPAGDWNLTVGIVRTVRGVDRAEPVIRRAIPIRVE